MEIEETYNIHKKLNCIFPHFKSKFLCKKGLHNYQLHSKSKTSRIETKNEFGTVIQYKIENIKYLRCYCCGEEIIIKED